ncbi:MAG: TetR/AcrR family transcriptional regulator [Chloroflexota bacterium]
MTDTPLSPHRRRKHAAMVDTILETARSIMREQGVAALTMQELARRLDLRAPSLYHYFAGKLDLYDALFRLGFSLYGADLERSLEGAESWQDMLRRAFAAYLEFAQHNPELYQLCFERPVPGFVPSAESLQLSFALLEGAYRRMRALKDGLRTDLSPEQVVDLSIAIMHGITAMHLANEPGLPAGQGRFASLMPAALAVLESAWSPGQAPQPE